MITEVEYVLVPHLRYGLVATGVLEEKKCEIIAMRDRQIIIHLDDLLIAGTRCGNGSTSTITIWTRGQSRASWTS